jgi:murein DD-endopeptidase MepM/ murein hydrolase activator NlpD
MKEARFPKLFARANGLDERGFKEWILYPGMLFGASQEWWGPRRNRPRPHEGLDLCFYRDGRDRVYCLDENTRIPVLCDGMVVGIIDDFLGKSLIVKHGLAGSGDARFCTIYGHTVPERDIRIGRSIRQGEVIATVASAARSRSGARPHLHISAGMVPKTTLWDELNWATIVDPDMMALMDPLQLIDRYCLAQNVPP